MGSFDFSPGHSPGGGHPRAWIRLRGYEGLSVGSRLGRVRRSGRSVRRVNLGDRLRCALQHHHRYGFPYVFSTRRRSAMANGDLPGSHRPSAGVVPPLAYAARIHRRSRYRTGRPDRHQPNHRDWSGIRNQPHHILASPKNAALADGDLRFPPSRARSGSRCRPVTTTASPT